MRCAGGNIQLTRSLRQAACTITSTVVAGITHNLAPGTTEIALSPVERVQVVETIEELATVRKAQGAAFIRPEARLIVWADKVEDLMTAARNIDAKMVRFVWERATGSRAALPMSNSGGSLSSAASSQHNLVSTEGVRRAAGGERLVTVQPTIDEKSEGRVDPEQLVTYQERDTPLIAPLHHGLGVALNVVIISLLIRTLIIELATDNGYMRLAILACTPALFMVTLFFSDSIIGGILQILGPIRQMSLNTRYYSGVAPERMTGVLPHITIQMPVYKEDLEEVLAPTIESLNKAIQTYELQGGTASVLVSEDGLLLVSEEERQRRLDYYDRNQVAWVARPGHNVDGYIRKGRFKKASNLNFTCAVSLAVEKLLLEKRPADLTEWTEADENKLYEECFQEALAAAHPLARGSGNIRIGELILMIDCDTRVPTDCFLDAASEMSQCPDVGILQHCSGVMQVTKNNYFEAGIAFFTRTVNFAISWVVANGDLAPFMGHNAFLRWSALQEVAEVDPDDGVKKVWAETTVSEDFEMALKLLMKGYIVRWATYSNQEFEEGVSLTCDDELNRWQKYAFGVSELVFRPIKDIWRGPITPLYRKFVWAKGIPVHYKFCATSYIFSYYAIAIALPLTIGLSIAQGYFAPTLDHAFIQPFRVFVAVVVVFNGLGLVGQILAKFRSRWYTLGQAMREHLTWLPFMIVFFTGLSYHVCTAVLAHPFGYNMTWGSTNKSLDDSNFFIELPAIFKKYWKMLIVCVATVAGFIVIETTLLPIQWQLHGGATVLFCPLWIAGAHILYHVALNPQLLRFSF